MEKNLKSNICMCVCVCVCVYSHTYTYIKLNHFAIYLKHCKSSALQLRN